MADKNTTQEDPEEVAAREAGAQVPDVAEADKKVVRANTKAEKEANVNEEGDEVDPAVHDPAVQKSRKV